MTSEAGEIRVGPARPERCWYWKPTTIANRPFGARVYRRWPGQGEGVPTCVADGPPWEMPKQQDEVREAARWEFQQWQDARRVESRRAWIHLISVLCWTATWVLVLRECIG